MQCSGAGPQVCTPDGTWSSPIMCGGG
jgi:hypothetical protein